MKSRSTLVLMVLCGLMLSASSAVAQFNYIFFEGTGSRATGSLSSLGFNHTTGTQWGSTYEERLVNLGFTFQYNGVNYTQVRVYHSGVMVMGSGFLSSPTGNDLSGESVPLIAGLWDEMRVTDNMQWQGTGCSASLITSGTLGSAPNRIFVVDWSEMGLTTGGQGFRAPATFQIRLYEGVNRIEFYYADVDANSDGCSQWGSGSLQTSASIGIGHPNGFLSVSPGSPATSSGQTSNNNINFSGTPIAAGTVYTFCPAGVTGNVAQGGTTQMRTGDTLFLGMQGVLSSTRSLTPFSHFNTCAGTFTYSITGPSASEYTIVPSSGSMTSAGVTPTINFSPTALGIRYAYLNVRDNGGVNRTYVLALEGIPRVTWVGNVGQGGTPDVLSGDTLFKGVVVPNNTVETFTPLTLNVANAPGPDAPITFTIDDPTGTFSVDPIAANVPPGSSISPVITIAPVLLVGWHEATLTVNAEGEIRTYLLRFFSSGSGALFFVNGEQIGAGAALFRNTYECVGTGSATVAIEVRSIGDQPFVITSDDAFLTETAIMQGTPPYELLRDGSGNFLPSKDYFVSDANGNPLVLPDTIAPLSTRIIYVTFVPTRTESRRTRAFFETDGTNFIGLDTNTGQQIGILNFEAVGYGLGSGLANPEKTGLPEPVVFPTTDVRDTVTMTGHIYNDGECDLQIEADEFRLVAGDVAEFAITEIFPGHAVNGEGNYVIAPGDTVSYTVSFSPSRTGSRLATIRVVSNDSTVYVDGVTERGNYYIDVYGVGKAGLEIRPVRLNPAVIDGPNATGVATLENNSGGLVTVTNVRILGSTEITEDPSRPWLSTPFNVLPGQDVDLSLLLTPTPGSAPGMRTATLEVTLSNGEVVLADISGLAGTRSVVAVPTSMFQGVRVPVGNIARQYLAVSNNGTLPVRISSMTLVGANRLDYRISPIVRSVIEPGTTEFFEVTYTPALLGTSSASIEIVTNSTNGTPIGTHTVTLGGEGTSAKLEGSDPSGSTQTPGESPAIRPSLGGGYAAMMASGTSLWQSTPNPTSGRVEIRYALPVAQPASIELYDVDGRVVRTFVEGTAGAGEQVVTADVSGLPSGRYYYMLRTSEGTLTLALDVVK